MSTPYYESNRAVAEYLLFHYGPDSLLLPYDFGPKNALRFPQRCITECLPPLPHPPPSAPPLGKALDLGCAVGASSFELTKYCQNVLALDRSQAFIHAATRLKELGEITFDVVQEGALTQTATARVDSDAIRNRVHFQTGDALNLDYQTLGTFDLVLMANLIDRLHAPLQCLQSLHQLLNPGGTLILTSPYTWLTEYTPEDQWLPNTVPNLQPATTFNALQHILAKHFTLKFHKDLPFLIREHARKFQWSVAHATVWTRH